MATEEKVTYCRICEPLCGMVATVEDGRLTKLRPDTDHPLSRGFACPKGIAMTEVQNDPDRVLHPLRRRADGSFERVTWPEALDEIGERLGADPRPRTAATRSAGTWATRAPSPTRTRSGSRASSTRSARRTPTPPPPRTSPTASPPAAFLYGSPFLVPIPDLARTDFLLVVGANPLVSHGSVLSAPRVKDQLHAIIARGGRVVVVDPRRSETARAFEHLADRPRLRRLAAALAARGDLRRGARGRRRDRAPGDRRRRAARAAPSHTPEATEARTGVAARARSASSPATSPAPSAPRSTGAPAPASGATARSSPSCSTRSTLVTGNLDREGGAMFGDPPIDFEPARRPGRRSAPTARCARGSATCPRCSARCRPR